MALSWLEGGAGAILLAGGVRQTFQDRLLMAGSHGTVLNEYLKSHSPEKVVGTLAALVKFLAALAKTPSGSEVPATPSKEPATETTTETAKAASTRPRLDRNRDQTKTAESRDCPHFRRKKWGTAR